MYYKSIKIQRYQKRTKYKFFKTLSEHKKYYKSITILVLSNPVYEALFERNNSRLRFWRSEKRLAILREASKRENQLNYQSIGDYLSWIILMDDWICEAATRKMVAL